MAHSYEIEIKSLLGEKENADFFRTRLNNKFPDLIVKEKHSQLNHYFTVGGDLKKLGENMLSYITSDKQDDFKKIIAEGKNYSIRTRDADGKTLFIIKASIGDDTSANGVSRMEFEVPVSLSIGELDKLLLSSGLSYQAKWSRDREEYVAGDTTITIDRNAGYGYLAEFERVVDDATQSEQIKKDLASLMGELGVEELQQDRLERMFAHYNEHWQDYYGTDNVFTIL